MVSTSSIIALGSNTFCLGLDGCRVCLGRCHSHHAKTHGGLQAEWTVDTFLINDARQNRTSCHVFAGKGLGTLGRSGFANLHSGLRFQNAILKRPWVQGFRVRKYPKQERSVPSLWTLSGPSGTRGKGEVHRLQARIGVPQSPMLAW